MGPKRSTRANLTSPLQQGMTPSKGARRAAAAKEDPLAYTSDDSLDLQSDDEGGGEAREGPGIEGIRTELKNFADTYVDDDLTTKLVDVHAEVKTSRVGIDRLSADVRGLAKAVTEGQQQLDVTLKSIGAQIVEALRTEEPLSRSSSDTSRESGSSAPSTASGARSPASTTAGRRGAKRKVQIPVPTDEQLTGFMKTQVRDPEDSGQRAYYSFVCRADESCNRVYKNWSTVNELKGSVGGEKWFKGHDDFRSAALHVKKEVAAMNK